MATITAVVFDLGGVLIDWNPRYLYRKMFDDDMAIDHMIERLQLIAWHRANHDTGAHKMAESAAELGRVHSEYALAIQAWADRHNEMIGGDIAETVKLLDSLRGKVALYALSNFAPEPVPYLHQNFPWMAWFDGIVISGEEGVAKPDPALFEVLTTRYAIDPRSTLFVDDQPANVAVAHDLGFQTIRFRDPEQLAADLRAQGLHL